MDAHQQLPSDGQLIVAARDGVADAWAELESRHADRALAVAKRLYGRHGKSRARIGLDKLRGEVQHGAVAVDDRNRALRSVRVRTIASVTNGGFTDPNAARGDEPQALASAFASLPEPWQAALWHHYVDGATPGDIVEVVGRSTANTVLLIERAADDLVTAFVEELGAVGVNLDAAAQQDRRSRIGTLLAESIVPRVTSMTLVDYRAAVGASAPAPLPARPATPGLAPTTGPATSGPATSGAPTLPAVSPMLPSNAPSTTRPTASKDVGVPGEPIGDTLALANEAAGVGRSTGRTSASVPSAKPLLPDNAASRSTPEARTPVPPAPVTRRRGRGLLVALLFAIIALALLGALIAAVDAVRNRGDSDSPAGAALAADEDAVLDTSSQRNVVSFAFSGDDAGAPIDPDLDVSVRTTGPVIEGGSTALRALIANPGARAVAPRFTLTLPLGVSLVDASGPATCTDPEGAGTTIATCEVAVAAGGVAGVDLTLALSEPAVGRLVVETNVVNDPIDVPIELVEHLVYSRIGRGEVLMVGNSVLSCDDLAPACSGARTGIGPTLGRRDLPAAFVGEAPGFGLANSSSARLDLGRDADADSIAAAYLFWAGDLEAGDVSIGTDAPIGTVLISAPGQDAEFVEATTVDMVAGDQSRYLASADVTEIVRRGGAGNYLVGNVQTVEVGGSFGGWALVVVTDDERKPLRQLAVLDPLGAVTSDQSASLSVPVSGARRTTTTLRVLSLDGDRGSVADVLNVNGTALGEAGDDPFDSEILGPRDPEYVDNFGTGIDEYRFQLDASGRSVMIDAASDDDEFLLAVITLSVDLE